MLMAAHQLSIPKGDKPMAVPPKPTAQLAVDGIVGVKTRDAAAWAFFVNQFTTGTAINGFPNQVI
jgi:hypothetical protein